MVLRSQGAYTRMGERSAGIPCQRTMRFLVRQGRRPRVTAPLLETTSSPVRLASSRLMQEPNILDVAYAWAANNREVLREAVCYWLEHGEWLTVLQLGRSALLRGSDADAFAALRQLPQPLGRVES